MVTSRIVSGALRRLARVFRVRRARAAATRLAAGFARRFSTNPGGGRVLFIEDFVPHSFLGAGFPRSNRILSELVRMGLSVTLYPTSAASGEDWVSVYQDVPLKVRVVSGRGLAGLEQFLTETEGRYDLLFVSRPHNMAVISSLLRKNPDALKRTKIVYDAEAIFCLREIERLRRQGSPLPPERAQSMIEEEVSVGKGSHCVVSVSERESRVFAGHGFKPVYTLSHTIKPSPTAAPFDSRRDILFVGAIHGDPSPNLDAVTWFSREILPIIKERLGGDVRLIIAGQDSGKFTSRLAGESVEALGKVDDLTPLYNRARVFVAPTRFAAGIPLKVYEAAAHGLPVVTTPLLASQLGWSDRVELLAADDAEGFAAACVELYTNRELWERLRANALERVGAECSPESFSAKLRQIVNETLGGAAGGTAGWQTSA